VENCCRPADLLITQSVEELETSTLAFENHQLELSFVDLPTNSIGLGQCTLCVGCLMPMISDLVYLGC